MRRLASVGLFVVGLAWGYVGSGVAEAFSYCPSWDECLTAEWLCERTKARAWKPCRREVARCFHAADRCHGGWTY